MNAWMKSAQPTAVDFTAFATWTAFPTRGDLRGHSGGTVRSGPVRSAARGAALPTVLALIALVLVILGLGLLVALWLKPPDLLRVGANYAAKIVCSNVFLAGRDPDDVLRTDVQAPGVALLKLMRVSVDRDRHLVRAGLFGFIGDGLAVDRPHTGCAAVPDGHIAYALQADALSAQSFAVAPRAAADAPWPDGAGVKTDAALDRLIADDRLAGPGLRAIVVVHRGRLVAERYAPGFSAATPLLGWSMTKTVLAGLVGLLIQDGRLTLDTSAGWPAAPHDGRDRIRIADLLAMSSGLHFNETRGLVSDLTHMLYLEDDTAGFARAQPLDHPPGENWSYSSGTANILSRLVQDAAAPLNAAYPEYRLFKPLGMTSAILETDAYGTLVGSSYLYATARDWARYGLFLAQDGIWQGHELLPRGYVAMMATPVPASGGQYGRGLVWLCGSDTDGIPADCFWLQGHDGQSMAIIPSRQLVILRMGLTPASENYRPQPLIHALLDATR